MKILIIHHTYTIIGGPERYLFNFTKMMEKRGHIVIPFSLNYKTNQHTPYSKFFPEPPFKEFNFDRNKSFLFKYLKVPFKNIYRKDVYKNLDDLIKQEQPDIAFMLSYGRKLTISVVKACLDNNIPIVNRISDFGQLCAKTTFYRNGQICEKCLQSETNLVRYKCVKDSYVASLFYYFVRQYERKSGYLNKINHMIFPSSFTAEYFHNSERFHNIPISHIPTFFDKVGYEIDKNILESRLQNPYFCYIGRIVEEKGVKLLIDAVDYIQNKTNEEIKLKMYGFDNNSAYSNYIKEYIKKKCLNKAIECYEFAPKDDLFFSLQNALFSLVPSIWYDNMPNSLIESQAYGVPVIASNFGSFKELIKDGENGYLFNPNEIEDLVAKLKRAMSVKMNDYQNLCVNSINWANLYCSQESHYSYILNVFKKYIQK